MSKGKRKVDADGFQAKLDLGTTSEAEALTATVLGVKFARRGDVFENVGKFGTADDMLIVVKLELPSGSTFQYTMTKPTEGQPLNKQSNIYAWVKRYGDTPHRGQEITVVMNDKGFFVPVL